MNPPHTTAISLLNEKNKALADEYCRISKAEVRGGNECDPHSIAAMETIRKQMLSLEKSMEVLREDAYEKSIQ